VMRQRDAVISRDELLWNEYIEIVRKSAEVTALVLTGRLVICVWSGLLPDDVEPPTLVRGW
jgi:hypothetical protein